MKQTTFIEVKTEQLHHPPRMKKDWKINAIQKGIGVVQHASPKISAGIIWHYFTRPGRSRFSNAQLDLMERAEIEHSTYRGSRIATYQWPNQGPKVLICHGWRSKVLDFRRIIEALLEKGYTVEGVDMRAHGNSEGKHTALPEYIDLIKNHISKSGPYDTVIGHSLGAIAAGLAMTELSAVLHPQHFFFLAGPPYVRYFFKDTVDEVGCNSKVYNSMCEMINEHYYQPIDYFDLRTKTGLLKAVDTHLVFSEDDRTVPFAKGSELFDSWPNASFVHLKGLEHHKVIANQSLIDYLLRSMTKNEGNLIES